MKRFVFSLQTVYEYKQVLERNEKAELRRAKDALQLLYNEDARLDAEFDATVKSQETALKQRWDLAGELARHADYFRYIRELKLELAEKIEKALELVRICQEKLVRTMKEVKTYGKLRDEQYAEYLVELAREEQKEMNDIVSFKVISGELV